MATKPLYPDKSKNGKQNLDEKKLVGVLSTDMSKAFDSLHSPLFITRLRAYGFSDEAIGLMRGHIFGKESTS